MSVTSDHLKHQAARRGFAPVGIAAAGPADGFSHFEEWLNRGYDGEMSYMRTHAEARRHPKSIQTEVKSVLMVAWDYSQRPANPPPRPRLSGKVARYAHGVDYHIALKDKLHELREWLVEQDPAARARAVVDTAPLLERDFARRAGLGWIGKNTMLINKHRGSYLLLGGLLTNLDLQPDEPHRGFHCGTCTACLEACPTDAFNGPGWLDSRKCISYLTIELRTATPKELRSGTGDWLFGCDVCQEVCPWNRKATTEVDRHDAAELLNLDEEQFRERFGGTALSRPGRAGLARNACIVLGNSGDQAALAPLSAALNDRDPTVREAAEWAIGRLSESSTPSNESNR